MTTKNSNRTVEKAPCDEERAPNTPQNRIYSGHSLTTAWGLLSLAFLFSIERMYRVSLLIFEIAIIAR